MMKHFKKPKRLTLESEICIPSSIRYRSRGPVDTWTESTNVKALGSSSACPHRAGISAQSISLATIFITSLQFPPCISRQWIGFISC